MMHHFSGILGRCDAGQNATVHRLATVAAVVHRLATVATGALLLLGTAVPLVAAEGAKPNVILVMTDDQGYGDLGCHGNPILKTPNLDALYGESIRFTSFHVSPFCTPTRAALMTGNYPGYTGAYRTSSGRTLMHRDEKTMAHLFGDNGYATGMVGKWHLGDNAPHRPQDRGFQDVVWHRCGGVGQASDYWGNDYFDDTYERNGTFEKFEGYCTDVWFREGIRFVEDNKDKPFLLYLALNAPHGPYRVPEQWAKPYAGNPAVANANFYGMIANIDHNMGILRRRLSELRLAENTILIFMTDNGTAGGGKFRGLDSEPLVGFNAGMRGKKSSVYDGGHRVPFFVHWPKGGLSGGKDIATLAAHIDVLPTLAELCDIPVSDDYKPDGVSLEPLLNESNRPWGRDHHVVQFHGGAHAIAFPPKPYDYSVVMDQRWRLVNSDGQGLYDIQADPAQSNNLADKHPDVVAKLRAYYQPFWEKVSPRLTAVRIDVGNPLDNPTVLCSQDWYMPTGNPPWNFQSISKLPRVTGPWMLEVKRAGRYRITLRQFPKEAEKPVVAVRAELEIAGMTHALKVEPESNGVVFEMDLPAGPTELVTWLYDENGKAGGAYFTEVEALDDEIQTVDTEKALEGTKKAAAEVYDVYLLAGQSNMDGRGDAGELTDEQRQSPADAIIYYRNSLRSTEGWKPLATGFSVPPKFKGSLPSTKFGPEIGFAAAMNKLHPENKLALIKGSKGGTSLREDWAPGKAGQPETQGPRYRDFLETIRLATMDLKRQGHTYVIRGLLWHQGESDSKASEQTYRQRLTELIDRIREDVSVPDLPVVIGEVFDNGKRDGVRAAQRRVGTSNSDVGLASAQGLTTWDDGTHFDAQSQWLLGQRFASAVSKRSGTAVSLSNGPSTSKPNVLFISVDDLNDWEGALGGNSQAITPNLDKLFREGVLFTNAHCSQAVCTASRNSLLSGIHPSRSGWYTSTASMRRTYDRVMGDHKMLPEYFRTHGYETLAAGKVFHQGVSDYKDRTKDFWDETAPNYKVPKDLLARGEGYGGKMFYPFPKNGSQIIDRYGKEFADGNSLCYGALDREDIPGGMMFDELIADWATGQLGRDHAKPFFLAVGFVRPHVPYTAPREFFDLYNLDDIKLPDVPDDEMSDIPLMGKSIAYGTIKSGDHYAVVNLSDSYWREMVYGYLACVSFADAQVGKVLDALAESQHADNTIVVLWSDHGQHLGEKKHWRKQSLWEESTRVPLCFRLPGQTTGSQCRQAVSLLDVYPTLVDLCDLPKTAKLEGESLVPQISDPAVVRDKPVLSTWYYRNHSIRSNDWRYIRYRDGSEELYDHRSDPGEHTNLAGRAEFANVIAEHQKWLPETDALPAGSDHWEGDKLDERVNTWKESNSLPAWLQ